MLLQNWLHGSFELATLALELNFGGVPVNFVLTTDVYVFKTSFFYT